MPPVISERTRHSAAACIEVQYTCRWNSRKPGLCIGQQPHRLLMTMSVQQDSDGRGPESKIEICRELFETLADGGHCARLPLSLASQKRGGVLLYRGETTGFTEYDLLAALGRG